MFASVKQHTEDWRDLMIAFTLKKQMKKIKMSQIALKNSNNLQGQAFLFDVTLKVKVLPFLAVPCRQNSPRVDPRPLLEVNLKITRLLCV